MSQPTPASAESNQLESYHGWFEPPPIANARPASGGAGDLRRADIYHCGDHTTLAVNVALATGRPLLVSGPSGCGKSSLSRFIAHVMGWTHLSLTVTSRTQARDLLYTVDDLKRLQDARTGKRDETFRSYIRPGVLWKAFDALSADTLSASTIPGETLDRFVAPETGNGTVVLLDEIDKADPDVPNNLLEPLGSWMFAVEELSTPSQRFVVRATRAPLMVLTTNGERRLPDAFLRRCVDLRVEYPLRAELETIATAHFKGREGLSDILPAALELVWPEQSPQAVQVSTAEFLDTLQACLELKALKNGWAWERIRSITLRKSAREDGT